eukprot:2839797-Rhodomonas_salina.1
MAGIRGGGELCSGCEGRRGGTQGGGKKVRGMRADVLHFCYAMPGICYAMSCTMLRRTWYLLRRTWYRASRMRCAVFVSATLCPRHHATRVVRAA